VQNKDPTKHYTERNKATNSHKKLNISKTLRKRRRRRLKEDHSKADRKPEHSFEKRLKTKVHRCKRNQSFRWHFYNQPTNPFIPYTHGTHTHIHTPIRRSLLFHNIVVTNLLHFGVFQLIPPYRRKTIKLFL